jgi:hypothetical protein
MAGARKRARQRRRAKSLIGSMRELLTAAVFKQVRNASSCPKVIARDRKLRYGRRLGRWGRESLRWLLGWTYAICATLVGHKANVAAGIRPAARRLGPARLGNRPSSCTTIRQNRPRLPRPSSLAVGIGIFQASYLLPCRIYTAVAGLQMPRVVDVTDRRQLASRCKWLSRNALHTLKLQSGDAVPPFGTGNASTRETFLGRIAASGDRARHPGPRPWGQWSREDRCEANMHEP